jgi:hypothetical protein
LGCYHRGTATPCPVHRHPCGGDRLGGREQRVALGGTTTPVAVTGWTWPRNNRGEGVTGVTGVHRRGEGGAPPGHRH